MESAGAFVYRLRDCPNWGDGDGERVRFSVGNIADYFVFLYDTMFIVECKTVQGKSIRWDAVKEKHLAALCRAAEHTGVEAGIMVHFRGDDQMVWFDARAWRAHRDEATKKSFNTQEAEFFATDYVDKFGRTWIWKDWLTSWLRRPKDYQQGIV